MKISVKWNMPNLRQLAIDAAKKVEQQFNADLRQLKANRGDRTDEQMAQAIRALAARHGVTLDAETVAAHSKVEQ